MNIHRRNFFGILGGAATVAPLLTAAPHVRGTEIQSLSEVCPIPKQEHIDEIMQHVDEIMRCIEDPIYFIETYFKIVDAKVGLTNVQLYDWQKRTIEEYKDNNVLGVLPRQSGKTELFAALSLYKLLFDGNYASIGIASPKYQSTQATLKKMKTAYDNLPEWMKVGIVTWNKNHIELENGNNLVAFSYSVGALRGRIMTDIFLDEAAYANSQYFEDFVTNILPCVFSSKQRSRIMMLSTPNGKNHYHAAFEQYKLDDKWHTFQLGWHQDKSLSQRYFNNTSPLSHVAYQQEILAQFV